MPICDQKYIDGFRDAPVLWTARAKWRVFKGTSYEVGSMIVASFRTLWILKLIVVSNAIKFLYFKICASNIQQSIKSIAGPNKLEED